MSTDKLILKQIIVSGTLVTIIDEQGVVYYLSGKRPICVSDQDLLELRQENVGLVDLTNPPDDRYQT